MRGSALRVSSLEFDVFGFKFLISSYFKSQFFQVAKLNLKLETIKDAGILLRARCSIAKKQSS